MEHRSEVNHQAKGMCLCVWSQLSTYKHSSPLFACEVRRTLLLTTIFLPDDSLLVLYFVSFTTNLNRIKNFSSCEAGNSYRLANMTRREENVAASSFKALSSLRSFIIVSDTMLFSVSYLVFRLDSANSAVCNDT